MQKKDDKSEEQTELYYHRKVPALQAWMEKLYQSKGGGEGFNCEDVEVTLEDLDNLENACKEESLDEDATGFFWGTHSDSDYKGILEAIETVREYLTNNPEDKIYYTSWW